MSDVLERLQDEGVTATLAALARMGVLSWDRVNMCYQSNEKKFGSEQLKNEIDKRLGR